MKKKKKKSRHVCAHCVVFASFFLFKRPTIKIVSSIIILRTILKISIFELCYK